MDEKQKEQRAHSLIRPWLGEKFRYYPKFDLGIGAEWMMGTAESVDTCSVDKEADMTSLLDCGFELDFLESIDMSVFDCDNDKIHEVSDIRLDIENAISIPAEHNKSDLRLKRKRKPLSKLDNHSRYASPCTDE